MGRNLSETLFFRADGANQILFDELQLLAHAMERIIRSMEQRDAAIGANAYAGMRF
jgi:hypothetical protein